METKVDKGLAKAELLKSLTGREEAGFVELLCRLRRPPRHFAGNSAYLRGFESGELFGILYRELFGDWDMTRPAISKVLENLDEAKRILGGTPLRIARVEHAKDVCPWMPHNLQVCNRETGSVSVTVHAWEKFYERFCKGTKRTEIDQVIEYLGQSFARAKRVTLRRGYATLRAIRNKFQPADYFFDPSINCRFVVDSQAKNKILLTAERP